MNDLGETGPGRAYYVLVALNRSNQTIAPNIASFTFLHNGVIDDRNSPPIAEACVCKGNQSQVEGI